MKYGIKNLTMDDIAKELGISKKTIYRTVENKADLVMMVVKHYLEEENGQLEQVLKTANNSIDAMVRMIDHFSTKIIEFNASALYDMKKYYPEAWEIYKHHQFQNVFNRISENLKEGVTEGMYRENLDTDVVARLYIGNIDTLLNPDYFPVKKYVFWDIYREYLSYHLHGVVSNKGLMFLEENNLFKK
jgi:AcrR family transcriptional regulator